MDEDEMFNTRPAYGTLAELESSIPDTMTSEMSPDEVAEKLDELLSILRPLAPVIAALPDLLRKVDPFLESAKASPVLKMLGIKL